VLKQPTLYAHAGHRLEALERYTDGPMDPYACVSNLRMNDRISDVAEGSERECVEFPVATKASCAITPCYLSWNQLDEWLRRAEALRRAA